MRGEKLIYRTDVDGLRALAVLSVVLFHAGVPGFSGGYVGVDVFFVISGFLITTILIKEDEYSINFVKEFYSRRIRRIFPALFAVLFVSSIFAILLFTPSELRVYSKSIAATSFSISNILFWRSADYFAPDSEDNPLLHTWSLGVEEQFYLILPILIFVLVRLGWRSKAALAIGLLVFVGALVSEALIALDKAFAFFMLPSRAWELLLGAWLAARGGVLFHGHVLREVARWVGLGLIIVSVFLFDDHTRFPGVSAFIPCLGALLLLGSPPPYKSPLSSNFLSLKPVVFVGLISYSLYLWHWPALVFPRLYLLRELELPESLLCVAVAICLAIASWRWVERPFRRSDTRRVSHADGAIPVGLAAMGVGLAVAVALSSGLSWRVPDQVAQLDSYGQNPNPKQPCADLLRDDPGYGCVKASVGSDPVKGVLWGDSHARQYAAVMISRALSQGVELKVASLPGFAPLLGVDQSGEDTKVNKKCREFNQRVAESIRSDPSIKFVIIGGRWSRFFFEDAEARTISSRDPRLERMSQQLGLEIGLGNTIRFLAGAQKRVILIDQAPEFLVPLPSCLAKADWRGSEEGVCRFKSATLPSSGYDEIIEKVAFQHPGVTFIDPKNYLCSRDACVRSIKGVPVNWDSDHLSLAGAGYILDRSNFRRVISQQIGGSIE